MNVLRDPRLDRLFDDEFWGDTETPSDTAGDSDHSARYEVAGIECHIIDVKHVKGVPLIARNYKHLVHRSGSGCAICGDKVKSVYYTPSLQNVKERGAKAFDEEFLAFHACNNCYYRMYRKASMPVVELIQYAKLLSDRGNKRGRTPSAPRVKLSVEEIADALRAGEIVLDGENVVTDDLTVSYDPSTNKLIIIINS